MLTRRRFGYAACALGLLLAASFALAGKPPPSPKPPLRYRITYLPTLPGTQWTCVWGMNDFGEIVGVCGDPTRCFLFQPNSDFTGGTMIDIDTLLPTDYPEAGWSYKATGICSINNSGQISGTANLYINGVLQEYPGGVLDPCRFV